MTLIIGSIIGSALIIVGLVSIRIAEDRKARTDLRVDIIRTTCDRVISGSIRRFSRVASHAICSFVVHMYKMIKVLVNMMIAGASHGVVAVWKMVRKLVMVSSKTVGKTAPTRYTVS